MKKGRDEKIFAKISQEIILKKDFFLKKESKWIKFVQEERSQSASFQMIPKKFSFPSKENQIKVDV